MGKADEREPERLVQTLERTHPDWRSSEIEFELRSRGAVAYGNWKDDTPNLRARLRQIHALIFAELLDYLARATLPAGDGPATRRYTEELRELAATFDAEPASAFYLRAAGREAVAAGWVSAGIPLLQRSRKVWERLD